MKPNVIINGGEMYLGLALQRYESWEKWRVKNNQPVKVSIEVVDNATIYTYCSKDMGQIRITGGAPAEIIFASFVDGKAFVYTYSYTEDVLSKGTLAGNVNADLIQGFNMNTGIGQSVNINTENGTIVEPKQGHGTYAGSDQTHELELTTGVDPSTLHVRVGKDSGPIVSRPLGETWMDELIGYQSSIFFVPRKHERPWNQMSGPEFWLLSPSTKEFFPSSWWVPNIKYAGLGSGMLVPGFYYGPWGPTLRDASAGTYENLPHPADEVCVTFGSLLDGRKHGALRGYGYCETLTTIEAITFNEIFFYLSSTPMEEYGNPSRLFQGLSQIRDAGTRMPGKEATFSVKPQFEPIGDYHIHFWSTFDDREEQAFTVYDNDYVVVVVSSVKNAEVHLWTGNQRMLFRTESYHSHSVSTDGRIFSIFEGSEEQDGTIARVVVFDVLHREETDDGKFAYRPGVPLRDSTIVASAKASQASIVPVRPEGFEPRELDYNPADPGMLIRTPDDGNSLLWAAPFGVLRYDGFTPSGFACYKLMNTDGIHARSIVYQDKCMEGNVMLVRAHGFDTSIGPVGEFKFTIEGQIYRGKWGEVITNIPYVMWSAAGYPWEVALAKWHPRSDTEAIPKPVSVEVESSAEDVTAEKIEVPTLVIFAKYGGGYTVEGAMGGWEIEEHAPPDLSNACPGQTYEWPIATATDGCGRTATMYDELTMTCHVTSSKTGYDQSCGVGDVFTPSGGRAPYRFEISDGSISADGEITSLPECPSDINEVEVTVIDDCDCESSGFFRIGSSSRVWILYERVYYAPPETDTCCDGGYLGTPCEGYSHSCCGGLPSGLAGTEPACDYGEVVGGDGGSEPTSKENLRLGVRCGDWCICSAWYAPCNSPCERTAPADFADHCWHETQPPAGSDLCTWYVVYADKYNWECPP